MTYIFLSFLCFKIDLACLTLRVRIGILICRCFCLEEGTIFIFFSSENSGREGIQTEDVHIHLFFLNQTKDLNYLV